jgi:uncharacterized membrane protein
MKNSKRLLEIDALRGLIMVFMSLDHANWFIAQQHSSGEYWGGDFPVYQEVLPFLVRFVTHLCAPGFFFLMGVGMTLFADSRRQRGWDEWAITRHFLLRGGLLMILQLLVVNRLWELTPGGWGIAIYIGVLFALGGAMILGSVLYRLRPVHLLFVALGFMIVTEVVVPDPALWGQRLPTLQALLLVAGGDHPELWVNYPVLAWMELLVFGLVFGYWFLEDREEAARKSLWWGVGFLVLFLVLRMADGFGNLRPRPGDDWMDFLNPVKYPPSITFTLMTTGVNLLVLRLFAWLADRRPRSIAPLAVFGSTPLFFYLLHLAQYAGFGRWLSPRETSLPLMLLYWLLSLPVLYLFCWWYGRFKRRQSPDSLFRFL